MRRIRLTLKGKPATGLKDELTRETPCIWDADGLKVQVFLCDLEEAQETFDITTIAGLTLEIRADDETTALIAGPLDPDAALLACTFDDWNDDDSQHAEFTLTGAQLNFAAGVKKFWLSIRATITGGQPLTFGAGYVKITGSLHGDSADPAENSQGGFVFLTSSTPDADGMHTFTARGKTWRLALTDFTDA